MYELNNIIIIYADVFIITSLQLRFVLNVSLEIRSLEMKQSYLCMASCDFILSK